MNDRALLASLQDAGVADVHLDTATRAAYSSDASLYRLVPQAVVMPRDAAELEAVLSVARTSQVPLTMRGAGTSVAGNAVGTGLVVDTSKHMNAVLSIDPDARLATVQPGAVQARLQAAAGEYGLRFGPDPSTHSRCTVGGMIGNDACGARSLAYGRTAHNVEELRVLTGAGEALVASRASAAGASDSTTARLRDLVRTGLGPLRTELGRFERQTSGYALHRLLPENGFDLVGALVGSEGTLAVVTEATVRLVQEPPHRVLVALGYRDIVAAGDAAPTVVTHRPTACEGLDARITSVVRDRRGAAAVPDLPRGGAWLFVELSGDDPAELVHRAALVQAGADAVDSRLVVDPAEAAALWRIREDGAGLSGRSPAGRPAWAGWEDAAVPPAMLGGYLREFEALLDEFGLTAMPFGHFGEGCIHVRVDVDLTDAEGPRRLRAFVSAASELVAARGGSLTGEHGDGRARSELLHRIYSPELMALFGGLKNIFDPDHVLNPGVIVEPAPLDAHLRRPAANTPSSPLALTYPDDGGSVVDAVHRCTGVGRCRSITQGPDVVMCPSYAATGDELHSTRGRARVLQEMLNGSLVRQGWSSPEVAEALDLCLACKGCASDCPTGVDMAAYKVEALHQRYRRRLRPRSHYTLGWLPRWAGLAARAPRLANAVMNTPGVRAASLWLAGVDRRRSVPTFATRAAVAPNSDAPGRVVVFLDSFTRYFAPEIAEAVATTISSAGFAPEFTSSKVCCGLPWISTGQLDGARRRLRRTVTTLHGLVADGVPVVAIEPSCAAVLRHDAVDLLGTPESRQVAAGVSTLAEFLTRQPDWSPPDLSGVTVVAQPHCHQHAVMGWATDRALLARTGAEVQQLGGCCGLAGNFGAERGHYDVSVAVARQQLLPALDAAPDAVYLADGFSCRTQASDLRGREGVHLAQLLTRG